jgi:hypothetical protein
MDFKPLVVMVGADKGGVGKTTVARTLIDYAVDHKIKFRAYDSEEPFGVLQRFYPQTTEILDLTKSANQMKVFDTLSALLVTIIDVRAGLLSPTLTTMSNVGLLNMVKNKDVSLAILHVLGPTLASLREIKLTADVIPGASHFLVKNHVNNTTFFDWDKEAYDAAFSDIRSGIIDIPQLDPLAAEHVENAGCTFTQYIANLDVTGQPARHSLVLRGYVKTWLAKVYGAYNDVGLHDILQNGSST